MEAIPEGSELHPSLKKLVVKESPGVPTKSFFGQLHNSSADVYVGKRFRDLAHCVDEALRHMSAVDWLEITYSEIDGDNEESLHPFSLPVSFIYDRKESFSWEHEEYYMARHLRLLIRGRRRQGRQDDVDVGNGDTMEEGDSYKLLDTCLGGHVWTSSLRQLTLDGIPDEAFIGIRRHIPQREHGAGEGKGDEREDDEASPSNHPFRLPSLEVLCFWSCREMRRLPMEILLSYLPALKVLAIGGCSWLTLSSVEEGIRFLPSLRQLEIYRCRRLLSSLTNNEDSILLPAPPLPLLREFFISDTRLLTLLPVNNVGDDANGRLFRNHLINSLCKLEICISEVATLTVEEEEGLMTLASSLHCLKFKGCPNLQNLPANLRGLLPNLKVLSIVNCPRIRCLPDGGLSASLEFLRITGCPKLAERCRPRQHATASSSTRGTEENGDWQKMVHVPIINVDDVFLRGTFRRFVELKAKWDFSYG